MHLKKIGPRWNFEVLPEQKNMKTGCHILHSNFQLHGFVHKWTSMYSRAIFFELGIGERSRRANWDSYHFSGSIVSRLHWRLVPLRQLRNESLARPGLFDGPTPKAVIERTPHFQSIGLSLWVVYILGGRSSKPNGVTANNVPLISRTGRKRLGAIWVFQTNTSGNKI